MLSKIQSVMCFRAINNTFVLHCNNVADEDNKILYT
mgnify:CR=1 FL=1